MRKLLFALILIIIPNWFMQAQVPMQEAILAAQMAMKSYDAAGMNVHENDTYNDNSVSWYIDTKQKHGRKFIITATCVINKGYHIYSMYQDNLSDGACPTEVVFKHGRRSSKMGFSRFKEHAKTDYHRTRQGESYVSNYDTRIYNEVTYRAIVRLPKGTNSAGVMCNTKWRADTEYKRGEEKSHDFMVRLYYPGK